MNVVRLVSKVIWRLAVLSLFFPRPGLASARPDWVTHPTPESGGYRLYVGRASHAPSEAEGFNEATRDALERAILENFGFRTHVQRQSYEAMDKVTAAKRVDEVSHTVEIHGFEQSDFYKEELSDSSVNVWVLYRYSVAAIAMEKARLAAHSEETKPQAFAELGQVTNKSGGILEIVTEPAGAHVSIDGEAAGLLTTPLRVNGQLAAGRHSIRIDHPSYEPVEEEVILLPGKTVQVHELLKKASAWLRVVTLPSNANVSVHGKLVGLSPVEVEVPAGVSIRVDVSHWEAESLSQEVEVGRDETRVLNLSLLQKPAYLSVASEPSGADVSVNGRPLGKGMAPTGLIRLEAGVYDIEVRKPGYESFHTSVSLRGTERKQLPTVRLHAKQLASNEGGADRDRENDYQYENEAIYSNLIPRALLPPSEKSHCQTEHCHPE